MKQNKTKITHKQKKNCKENNVHVVAKTEKKKVWI